MCSWGFSSLDFFPRCEQYCRFLRIVQTVKQQNCRLWKSGQHRCDRQLKCKSAPSSAMHIMVIETCKRWLRQSSRYGTCRQPGATRPTMTQTCLETRSTGASHQLELVSSAKHCCCIAATSAMTCVISTVAPFSAVPTAERKIEERENCFLTKRENALCKLQTGWCCQCGVIRLAVMGRLD